MLTTQGMLLQLSTHSEMPAKVAQEIAQERQEEIRSEDGIAHGQV
jgi:hypothetical protein